jgi:hypothetical protein
MATTTKHPVSILDLHDAGTASYRTAAGLRSPRWDAIPDAPASVAAEVERPEPYLSKRELAEHYAMSVRWVEQRIVAGLPVADYMEKRPRFRLSETDDWLRTNGHLSGERPKAPRPGTKKVAV